MHINIMKFGRKESLHIGVTGVQNIMSEDNQQAGIVFRLIDDMLL